MTAKGAALALLLGAWAGGCSEDQKPTGEPDATGALTGTLQNFVADFDDGHSERHHFLELSGPTGDRSLRLLFGSEPTLSSGDKIRVWGTATPDNELQVGRFEVVSTAESELTTVRSALTTVTPKQNKNAFVLVDLGGGVNTTAAAATTAVFTPGNNFANVYNILSYGSMNYVGDVVGPFPYSMTTCDYNGLRTAVKAMITTGTYDHYMWYLGSNQSSCAWSGLGAEGNATKPASDSWYNASTGCTVLVQEVGHNNGWMHSSTLTCSGASFVDDPTGSGCTTSEYGNRYTPMGQGCGHFDAMDKWYGQYFGGCNGVKVTSTGTFNLMPIETPCNGIQGIQLPMPKTTRTYKSQQGSSADPIKNYYLELRVNGTPAESTQVKAPAVFVNVGNDIQPANRTSFHSFLLDMTPGGSTFEGMTAGQSFTDPAGGLTFTVMTLDATHASIQVTYDNGTGNPTCMDGSTLVAPGPLDCGASTTGTGGSTGTAGTTGAAGRGGSTGTAGTTGTAGRGGSTGTAGTTGAAGRGGSTGTAGTTGTTGTAGTTGAAGRGGSTGTAGTTGTSTGTAGTTGTSTGTAGTTGTSTGTAGTTGTSTGVAGAVGTAGAGGPTGTAGSTVSGTAGSGSTGSGGIGPPDETPGAVVGGCACSTPGGGFAGSGWLSLVGIAAVVSLRRRRRAG